MTVKFEIQGVRNSTGKVRGLAFTRNNGGFPENVLKASVQAESKAKKGITFLTFKVPSGEEAAFSFFHDEKETGKIEKNFLGIPKSGIGATNWNGKSRPKFLESVVKLQPVLTAKLKYF